MNLGSSGALSRSSLDQSAIKSVVLWTVIGLLFALAMVTNLWVIPGDRIVATLYVVQVLIAARWFSSRAIVVVGFFAVALFLVNSIVDNQPASIGLLGALGLLIVGYLAFELVTQRETAFRQARELEAANFELRLSQERLRVALSQADVVVYNQDRDLRYTAIVNPHQTLSAETILGRVEEDIFPADEARRLSVLKRKVLETGVGARQDISLTLGGQTMIYDLRIEPLLDEIGRIIGITGSSIDITERKRAAEEREQLLHREQIANERLQRFLALVAHDLSQPLTIIQGSAQLLTHTLSDRISDMERSRLNAIRDAARRMARLVDDLRQAAAIGAGHFTIAPAAVDLVAVARQVVTEQQERTNTHRIVLSGSQHLQGEWDRDRLVQLLTNLITNAVKYSPEGGDVRVTIESSGNDAIVRVADSGIGIAREHVAQLFTPFTRVHTDQTIAGTGLGLYICRAIVEAHGGQIAVESTPGQGSTFIVTLPCKPRVEPSPGNSDQRIVPPVSSL